MTEYWVLVHSLTGSTIWRTDRDDIREAVSDALSGVFTAGCKPTGVELLPSDYGRFVREMLGGYDYYRLEYFEKFSMMGPGGPVEVRPMQI